MLYKHHQFITNNHNVLIRYTINEGIIHCFQKISNQN